MSLFNWITSKIKPPAADQPSNPTSIEVLALSREAVDSITVLALPVKSPSPSSSSVPIQNESVIEDDAIKATFSFAPPASASHTSSALATNISRGKGKARNINFTLPGESSRLSSTARDSNLRPLTPYPPPITAAAPLAGGGLVPGDGFNEFKKEMESQLQEANNRTQEAYRQLWEQEQRHKSERLNWQQQFGSMEKPSSSNPSRSVQQQTSPRDGPESSLGVNTKGNGNLGASQADGFSLRSHISLPFKLRKLSTELILGRAEACMILREWSEMEKRSHEAMAMASNLHHEPLTARCWFFLGVARYHLKKWALSSDSFEFAKPCVDVYITARELYSWTQKIDSAMGASPAGSIESTPHSPSERDRASSAYNRGWEDLGGISSSASTNSTPSVRSVERVSNIGRMNNGSPWSGRSTPESIGDLISSHEELPMPHKRSLRRRYKTAIPETLPSIPIPAHGDRSSSPSPLDVDGRKIAIEYWHRKTPLQPRTRGLPLTLVIPDISFSVRPRQSRLYTPGDDHVYPGNPLRQGPRLRLIIPVKIFPGPGPVFSIPLRPSRIYMPDNPDIALYPQNPFRQGERLKINIPSTEPVSPPLEINKLPGYHTMSTSSSTGSSPVQAQRPPPRRLQARQVFPKTGSSTTSSFGKIPSSPFNPSLPFSRSSYREISSSAGYRPFHTQRPPPPRRAQGRRVFRPKARSSTTSSFGKLPSRPFNPSLPFSRLSYRETGSTFGESSDEVSRFIQELSQPAYIKRRRVSKRSFSGSDSSAEESFQHTYNSAVPSGLRVVKRASSTPESSPGKPPPIPKRPGLRVVNRTPSTSESSPERLPSLPDRPRLRVVNRSSSTPECSPEKPPIPVRLRPPMVNCTSPTPESRLDESSRKNMASPGHTSFILDGRSMSQGGAIWVADTGSGCARFLDSPEDHPDGLFDREITHPYEVEYDDSRKGVPIEMGFFDSPRASTRPDIRQMEWRSPSTRDSMQPQGRGVIERSDSIDETENMAFFGLGITTPTETPRRG